MTALHSYEIRDPGMLIRDVAGRIPLAPGLACLALVAKVSTEQRVLRVDRLRLPAEIVDPQQAEDELRRVVETWAVPDAPGAPEHSPVLVVVRPGYTVFGPNEGVWLMAERYVNHLKRLWSMDMILVTEHGWADLMSGLSGASPALARGA